MHTIPKRKKWFSFQIYSRNVRRRKPFQFHCIFVSRPPSLSCRRNVNHLTCLSEIFIMKKRFGVRSVFYNNWIVTVASFNHTSTFLTFVFAYFSSLPKNLHACVCQLRTYVASPCANARHVCKQANPLSNIKIFTLFRSVFSSSLALFIVFLFHASRRSRPSPALWFRLCGSRLHRRLPHANPLLAAKWLNKSPWMRCLDHHHRAKREHTMRARARELTKQPKQKP